MIPVSPQDIALAHDPNFVTSILACRRENGFGNRREDVAQSLPFTTGALLCAAREALKSGIACAPVSRFHHENNSAPVIGRFATNNTGTVTFSTLQTQAAGAGSDIVSNASGFTAAGTKGLVQATVLMFALV